MPLYQNFPHGKATSLSTVSHSPSYSNHIHEHPMDKGYPHHSCILCRTRTTRRHSKHRKNNDHHRDLRGHFPTSTHRSRQTRNDSQFYLVTHFQTRNEAISVKKMTFSEMIAYIATIIIIIVICIILYRRNIANDKHSNRSELMDIIRGNSQ